MAVYTTINKKKLSSFLNNYDIGSLENYEGILEGVENTNYKIITSKNIYILTIFEKRVNESELPFFIELQNYLSEKNIKCPQPIANQKGDYIDRIENKPCVIMSFLAGQKIINVQPHHCYQVGNQLAKIHKHTKDFSLSRENNLHQKKWRNIYNKCQYKKTDKYNELFVTIEKELEYLENNWPANLPKGIIHADFFKDNVFFIENTLSGVIDFYFACNDFYSYELAICINAWCFDTKGNFDQIKYLSILEGYQIVRALSPDEIKSLPILLRGATIRILLTRLHDQLYNASNAYVLPKDAMEYLSILEFHHKNPVLEKKMHDN